MSVVSLRSACFFSFLLTLVGMVVILRSLSTTPQWEIVDFNGRNYISESGNPRFFETIRSGGKLDHEGPRKSDKKVKYIEKMKGDDLLLYVLLENVSDFQTLSSVQRQYIINILSKKLDTVKSLSCDWEKCDGAKANKNTEEIITGNTTPLTRSKINFIPTTSSAEPAEHVIKQNMGEILVEHSHLKSRTLTPYEAAGNDIMFTLRTTLPFHDVRLPLLMDTWISKVNRSNIHLVSDGRDPIWENRVKDAGIHYINSLCSRSKHRNLLFTRDQLLCCKAGVEVEQLFKAGNEDYNWLCHVDDDMYVLVPPLVHLLSKFHPTREAIYLGRSGSPWGRPRKVMEGAKFGNKGQDYHFAVGGMYCLSRAMVELAKPYIVGQAKFNHACASTREPEDVTIGVVIGVMLNKTLSRTEEIYTHGLELLSAAPSYSLSEQVAFSYGYGSVKWSSSEFNAISVPEALYTLQEDPSQFRSLYCHLYPNELVCKKRKKGMLRAHKFPW